MELREEVKKYYNAAKVSRKVANLKIVDEGFTFFHLEDQENVAVFFDLKSKVVVMVQKDSNGNSEDDDISLEGFAKYVDVLTVEKGIKIQTEQLEEWKKILKKKVFIYLVGRATASNHNAKTGYNIVRGDDLKMIVYEAKRLF